eukprot:CAMPEP_0118831478 /NCGR_PEP_ID=MMETSP1162-20130426/30977_1 /TAXON_ID=33656 /ORGANISM="Phaeocystis Sp, Strain CCMP2710" /LENGTH=101 /DNA_ID=CAMNT_0006762903 /DNA_START=175 /DNA_END=481 /DNA_ORIENTATION=+
MRGAPKPQGVAGRLPPRVARLSAAVVVARLTAAATSQPPGLEVVVVLLALLLLALVVVVGRRVAQVRVIAQAAPPLAVVLRELHLAVVGVGADVVAALVAA